jgi:hypothetical protein
MDVTSITQEADFECQPFEIKEEKELTLIDRTFQQGKKLKTCNGIAKSLMVT